jgi:hypothetical protein
MMKPKVTVLIDTYNHERFVGEAIGSVLESDFLSSETELPIALIASGDGVFLPMGRDSIVQPGCTKCRSYPKGNSRERASAP